jgi:hypothetical protein
MKRASQRGQIAGGGVFREVKIRFTTPMHIARAHADRINPMTP